MNRAGLREERPIVETGMMLGEIPVEVLATKGVLANTLVSHFVPAAYPALPEGSLAAPPLGLVNITIRAA